jgi:hypothetical protein
MTKNLIVSALAAAIVSLFVTLPLIQENKSWIESSTSEIQPITSPDSPTLITDLKFEVQQIRDQLQRLSKDVERISEAGSYPISDDLAARIETLETAMEGISPKRLARTHPSSHRGAPDRISENSSQSRDVVELNQYTLAEQEFQLDSGTPLGDFPDSIEEVIHQVDAVDLTGMECGNSICRVTYENNGSLSQEGDDVDPRWQIMERLLDRSSGKRVDIRHATDSLGTKTMYIQLQ